MEKYMMKCHKAAINVSRPSGMKAEADFVKALLCFFFKVCRAYYEKMGSPVTGDPDLYNR